MLDIKEPSGRAAFDLYRRLYKVQVKTVKISELRPHPKNPRVHPDSAIEKLERSIKEFGWTNPILVSADGYILAGHARLKAKIRKEIIEEVREVCGNCPKWCKL